MEARRGAARGAGVGGGGHGAVGAMRYGVGIERAGGPSVVDLGRCCCACAGGGVVGDGAWCGEMMAMLVMKPAGDPSPPGNPKVDVDGGAARRCGTGGPGASRRREGGDVAGAPTEARRGAARGAGVGGGGHGAGGAMVLVMKERGAQRPAPPHPRQPSTRQMAEARGGAGLGVGVVRLVLEVVWFVRLDFRLSSARRRCWETVVTWLRSEWNSRTE